MSCKPGSHHYRRIACLCAAIAVGAVIVIDAFAIDDSQLQIDSVRGNGWEAQQVTASVDWGSGWVGAGSRGVGSLGSGSASAARITAARVELPGGMGTLEKVHIDCGRLDLSGPVVICQNASLSAALTALPPPSRVQNLTGQASYDLRSGAVDFSFRGRGLGAEQLRLAGRWRPQGWSISAHLERADLPRLAVLAGKFIPALLKFSVDGRADLRLEARGNGASLAAIEADAGEGA